MQDLDLVLHYAVAKILTMHMVAAHAVDGISICVMLQIAMCTDSKTGCRYCHSASVLQLQGVMACLVYIFDTYCAGNCHVY